MEEEKGLESLVVWQKAMAYAIKIQQEILPRFPAQEKYALASQLRRSVQSVPGNIAEGYGRYYYQEGVHFCYIARGSLEESLTYLTIAHSLGYLQDEIFKIYRNELIELRKLLNGYIAFLKKSKRGENEPGSRFQTRDDQTTYLSDVDSEDEI